MDKRTSPLPRYIVGITGASGSIYGYQLVQELLADGFEVHLIVTDMGKQVMAYELEKPFDDLVTALRILEHVRPNDRLPRKSRAVLHLEETGNLFSPVASGSYPVSGMVIAPCSMGTLGKIAAGTGDNLLIRAADVCLKEKSPLVLLPRETPLSAIHLQNMLRLHRSGAVILPPMPAFYPGPVTIRDLVDQTVGRALSCLGIKSPLQTEWKGGTKQKHVTR